MEKEIVKKLGSAQIIPISFLVAILLGAWLLTMPAASADGKATDFVTALFTSTTSTCVTGLVVVDTFAKWSLFGKIVILILIQLGGLGIITITSTLMLMIYKRFSLGQSVLLHDAFNLNSIAGLRKFLIGVFSGTLLVEGIGALIYMIRFIPQYGGARGAWYAVFNSISSFCNAGIDILGPDSLMRYDGDALVQINTMFLIIMGGLGYVVWFDIGHAIRMGIKKKYSLITSFKRVSEHTKLVISMTFALIAIGAIIVLCMEFDNEATIGNMGVGKKVLNSVFQSVTFRTAGFATIPQQGLKESTALIGSLFMFIGGSPVGTAGGVKTVTFFLVIANARSFIRSRNETVVFGRSVPADLIQKANAIVLVRFAVTFILLIGLIVTNELELMDAMYETFSATATVGLSRAVTPSLNTAGRLIIIVAMYLGRIGPISMALFFRYKGIELNKVRFVKGNFFVG